MRKTCITQRCMKSEIATCYVMVDVSGIALDTLGYVQSLVFVAFSCVPLPSTRAIG